MSLNPNVQNDDEQKAAESFVVTPKQQDANLNMEAQIAKKIQPIIDDKLVNVRSKEIQEDFDDRRAIAIAARTARNPVIPTVIPKEKTLWQKFKEWF